MSPSASACRIIVLLAISPLINFGATTVTPKPISCPRARSVSALPSRFLPKEKSGPMTRPRIFRCFTSRLTNSLALSLASSRLKDSATTISTPSFFSSWIRSSTVQRYKSWISVQVIRAGADGR